MEKIHINLGKDSYDIVIDSGSSAAQEMRSPPSQARMMQPSSQRMGSTASTAWIL